MSYTSTATSTFGGTIAGSTGSVTVNSTGGGLTLSAAQSYAGATTITSGTLTVNGSLAAGSTVTVQGGTLAGSGAVNGNVNLTSGNINLGYGGNLAGTLSVSGTGGNWNGQGSVTGAINTAGSSVFTVNGNLTANGGLNIASDLGAATLSGSSSSSITGSINYTSTATSTFNGNVYGSGTVSVDNGGQLTLGGYNLYSGATNINNGTLAVPNGIFGGGGTITLQDNPNAVLAAGGTITRNIVANGQGDYGFNFGATPNGTLLATSNLTVGNASTVFAFNGTINTQGNSVTIVSAAPSTGPGSGVAYTGFGTAYYPNGFNNSGVFTVRSLTVSNGATLGSNGTIYMPDDVDIVQGSTGLILLPNGGNVTINGNFFGGTSDSGGVFIYDPTNTGSVTFTGVVYGVVSSQGAAVNYTGLQVIGFSPTLSQSNGGNGAALSLSVDSATQPTKIDGTSGTRLPTYSYPTGTGYGTVLVYASPSAPGTPYVVGTAITLSGDSTSPYTASTGDTLYVIRSDAHLWPKNSLGTFFTDGTISANGGNTIPSIATGSNFTIPGGTTMYSSLQTGQGGFVRIWFGNVMPSGSGTWLNAGGTGNWSSNATGVTYASSSANGNYPTSFSGSWGSAGGVTNGSTTVFGIPGTQGINSAGQIATFDNSISAANYNGGNVNLDIAVTLGGISLTNTANGGYTIATSNGSTLTFDNGSLSSAITVNSGSTPFRRPLQ